MTTSRSILHPSKDFKFLTTCVFLLIKPVSIKFAIGSLAIKILIAISSLRMYQDMSLALERRLVQWNQSFFVCVRF